MIVLLSEVIGWLYFFLWSASWYPQILDNWRRKSVVGLHFDYVAYNIIGHLGYSIFNVALLWVPFIQAQYLADHPGGVIPVKLNDTVFSLHSILCCIVLILQCMIYERDGQHVSRSCIVLLMVSGALVLLVCSQAAVGRLRWLAVLYLLSGVKLAITLIKNIPQVALNYRRKSTVGWSVGGVLADFCGGICSLLQMVIIAAESDDWGSLTGNPTKVGLGLLSTLFDVIFLLQHYCWYKENNLRLETSLMKSYDVYPKKVNI